MDNPETLATLGTQDTGQINVRENPRGNQEKDNPETLAILGTQDTGQINVSVLENTEEANKNGQYRDILLKT
jgi:hypothetical protein